jgi:hypothetical protein
MKYLEALKKRDLGIDNLPKTLQKKIIDLNSHYEELKKVQNNTNQELNDSDLDELNSLKDIIDELDNHIAHKINIFDQTKYDDKLAKISKMTKAKQGLKEGGEIKEVVVQEPKVQEPLVTKVVAKVVAMNPDPKPAPTQESYVAPLPPQAPEEVYEEEDYEEEFERKGDGKPKKMTTGLILMGVGAFFLTWGAVNFFKSRR